MVRAHTETVSARGTESARAFLVPGNDLCAAFYRPLAEELATHGLTTTLATLPGFHGLPGWAEPSFERYVAEVSRAAREAAPGGVLIGHSLGGLLAILAAARSPDLARRLVLLEPFVLPLRSFARAAAKTYRAQVIDGQGDAFVNWTGSFRRVHDLDAFPGAAIELYREVRRTTAPGTVAALFEQLEGLYPLPFEGVQVPTLILRGASSGWRNALVQRLVGFSLPQASLRVVPRMGHWMANEDDPRLAREIAGFAMGGAVGPPTA